jgi:hypothetical protein
MFSCHDYWHIYSFYFSMALSTTDSFPANDSSHLYSFGGLGKYAVVQQSILDLYQPHILRATSNEDGKHLGLYVK